jgi:hypothetical protein
VHPGHLGDGAHQACGGTGTVLRAITASDYRTDPCPVCDPAERAG